MSACHIFLYTTLRNTLYAFTILMIKMRKFKNIPKFRISRNKSLNLMNTVHIIQFFKNKKIIFQFNILVVLSHWRLLQYIYETIILISMLERKKKTISKPSSKIVSYEPSTNFPPALLKKLEIVQKPKNQNIQTRTYRLISYIYII